MLLSLAVVGLVGVLLLDQVQQGVLATQRRSAVAEAGSGLVYAQSVLRDVPSSASRDAADAELEELTQTLAGRGGQAGTFDVIVVATTEARAVLSASEADDDDVPASLRRIVTSGSVLAYAYGDVRRDGRRQRALVVGAPLLADVPGGPYELYFVFPVGREQQTLSLVGRTLAAGGLGLAVLVAAVAGFVTRTVVSPVRLAAQVAEQFASGRLESRMRATGEDEIARLAEAFNEMASTVQDQIVRLQELSRVQQRFVADVSHELRTPLTTVRMAADLLHGARADFAPEVARAAELLQAELDRFEALLVDLLEISRFDAGAAVLDRETVDLRALVHRVVDGLQPLAERRGSELHVRAPAGGHVLFEGDSRRIERVLRNLVANAVEHGEGRPVELTLAADDHAVAVRVLDHGVGLKPGDAQRVFSRFWRGDPSRARHTGGTGLGLAIALEDVRLHGGWLQAWGAPGVGAAFRVTLPRHGDERLTSSPLALEPTESTHA